jgi:hypothetical protein
VKQYLTILILTACAAPYRTLAVHGEWLEKPDTLELCDDLNVDHDRVLEQVNWWHNEINPAYPKFTWDDVVYSDCLDEVMPGTIRVRKSEAAEVIRDAASAWAEYSWSYKVVEDPPGSFNSDNYIDACTVNIGKLNTKWVIRHEFGHCWGWDHTELDQWSHVMSPWVGRDTEGLEEVPTESWSE